MTLISRQSTQLKRSFRHSPNHLPIEPPGPQPGAPFLTFSCPLSSRLAFLHISKDVIELNKASQGQLQHLLFVVCQAFSIKNSYICSKLAGRRDETVDDSVFVPA